MGMKRLIWAVVIGMQLAAAPALAQSTDEVVYYHTDAIGSVRMMTDASGAVILPRYDFYRSERRGTRNQIPTCGSLLERSATRRRASTTSARVTTALSRAASRPSITFSISALSPRESESG